MRNDCAVEVDGNAYSVPWRLIGERVEVTVAAGQVRVRHGVREVAVLRQADSAGKGPGRCRMPARVSPKLHARLEAVPKAVRDIAWKAQVRLCNRYRRLAASGKAKAVHPRGTGRWDWAPAGVSDGATTMHS